MTTIWNAKDGGSGMWKPGNSGVGKLARCCGYIIGHIRMRVGKHNMISQGRTTGLHWSHLSVPTRNSFVRHISIVRCLWLWMRRYILHFLRDHLRVLIHHAGIVFSPIFSIDFSFNIIAIIDWKVSLRVVLSLPMEFRHGATICCQKHNTMSNSPIVTPKPRKTQINNGESKSTFDVEKRVSRC